jgi:hypothetical protein
MIEENGMERKCSLGGGIWDVKFFEKSAYIWNKKSGNKRTLL